MAKIDPLGPRDQEQLADVGISTSEIRRQLELFRRPPPAVQLLRPCRPGDGIVRLSEAEQTRYVEGWRSLASQRVTAKFVPASGAATRMFKDLTVSTDASISSISEGSQRLLETLPMFAFSDALEKALTRSGLELRSLIEIGDAGPILEALLGSSGLDYGQAAKGLLLFHRYPTAPRTALEDQIREGCGYLTSTGDTCRFHFTVTDAHRAAFEDRIARFRAAVESQLDATLEIEFSTQNPNTDTVAVHSDNRLVRRSDGALLLRPAGHGALLKNLQSVDADLVFIKNIDNVAHERLHPTAIHWKRVLAGYFGAIQDQIFTILTELDQQGDAQELTARGLQLIQDFLAVEVPTEVLRASLEARRQYVVGRLDRPLRVCGVVKNEGEPGGGPFWLPDDQGSGTGQIVEAAQVDLASSDQAEIWNSSTHFNPVDLVCGLRDRAGHPYDLARFLDPSTSFVAEKTHSGQTIQVLERPGLWNGSMAGWNTAFVEVPLQTFTPVKTVFDLVRPEHQP